jgi:hypothetical protein
VATNNVNLISVECGSTIVVSEITVYSQAAATVVDNTLTNNPASVFSAANGYSTSYGTVTVASGNTQVSSTGNDDDDDNTDLVIGLSVMGAVLGLAIIGVLVYVFVVYMPEAKRQSALGGDVMMEGRGSAAGDAQL